jgi:hypothetical protein
VLDAQKLWTFYCNTSSKWKRIFDSSSSMD